MSEIDGTRTICIPSLAFNYVNNRLESIGYQGELYVRQLSIHAELDYIEDKSRWHELFGTPERAAVQMLSPDEMSCKWCLLHDHCKDECLIEDYDTLLEWLRGDSDGE